MYEFHYDYMKPKFKDLCRPWIRVQAPVGSKDLKLCYMDTDSFIYNIKTQDFYADIVDDLPAKFDTSGYCPNGYYIPGTAGRSHQPLPIGPNRKVIGSMKDELGGTIMTEFIALRPKLYSYKKLNGAEDAAGQDEVKKCKEIKKCVVKNTPMFEDYKNCLFISCVEDRSQLMFRSMKHHIFTIEVNKVALNRDDDKRISEKDGISTLACGHKSLS